MALITQLAAILGLPRGVVLAGMAAAMVALGLSGLAWLRSDAVRDRDAREAVEDAHGRVQTLEEGDRRRKDVEALDDDGLRERLLEWLR